MPLTTSTIWDEDRLNMRSRRHIIVKLTDGTDTWYFGDAEMELTDGHVYQLLQGDVKFRSGIDIYSKRWPIPTVNITLNNLRKIIRSASSDSFKRASELLLDIRHQAVAIYFFLGDRMTQLSDCLNPFNGYVSAEPIYTFDTVIVKAAGRQMMVDKMLPPNLMEDAFGNLPIGSEGLRIPWMYGEFDYDQDQTGNGLAVVIPTDKEKTEFVASDHDLDALTELWAHDGRLSEPVEYQSKTLTPKGAGDRGLAELTASTVIAYLWPNQEGGADDYVACPPPSLLGIDSAIDRFTTTYQQLNNNLVQGVYMVTDPEGIMLFTFPEEAFLQEVAMMGGTYKLNYYLRNHAATTTTDHELRLYFWSDGTSDELVGESSNGYNAWYASTSWLPLRQHRYEIGDERMIQGSGLDDIVIGGSYTGSKTLRYWFQVTSTGTPDQFSWHDGDGNSGSAVNMTGSGSPVSLSHGITVYWGATTGHTLSDAWECHAWRKERNQAYMAAIWVKGDKDEYIGDPHRLWDIFEFRLQVKYSLHHGVKWWTVGKGREYDTWISSRSSNYASGDMIKDPAGVAESVFRHGMGFADADLDLPTFIDCEDTSLEMRVNLHSKHEMKAGELLRRIAEQSTFCVCLGADGKGRLVNLADKSPTTTRIIPFSHIRDGRFIIRKTKMIRNQLIVLSRWREEVRRFCDSNADSPIEDATSQSDLAIDGTPTILKYNAKWKFLAGSAIIAEIGGLYVNSTDGIWSKQHVELIFETEGFLDADLVAGDWLEMESTTWDPQTLCYGSSWSAKQFLIEQIEPSLNGTRLTMIELW